MSDYIETIKTQGEQVDLTQSTYESTQNEADEDKYTIMGLRSELDFVIGRVDEAANILSNILANFPKEHAKIKAESLEYELESSRMKANELGDEVARLRRELTRKDQSHSEDNNQTHNSTREQAQE